VLADELEVPVHALALHTYPGSEWSENQWGAPDFFNCLGGSKAGSNHPDSGFSPTRPVYLI
tara:strand:+ start:447 stop:629 length:183 start_codon:yes stop_codon:yes gene_type:complete